MVSKRNGEIDLLRFVFALFIVCYHFNLDFQYGLFVHGYIGVEFFFVVTGFLMARHAKQLNLTGAAPDLVAEETWRYLLNKVRSFYAYYLCAILVQVPVRSILVNHTGPFRIVYEALRSLPTLTLSFMGLMRTDTGLYVSNTWFLSSMLIVILLLYPLLLRQFKYATALVFPLLSLFLLGYLYANQGVIGLSGAWMGFAYFGVLRAAAEMALGASLFQLSCCNAFAQSPLLHPDRLPGRLLLTLFKYGCYAVVLAFGVGSFLGHPFEQGFDLHALFFCALGVLLSFSDVGFRIPDCGLTRRLGRLSLPIFIFHGFIRKTCWEAIGHPVPGGTVAGLIAMSVLASVLLMFATDFLVGRLKRKA